MTVLVLVILAGVWIGVLVPPWLRNRAEGRPADSISSFRRQLSVLERTNPGAPVRADRVDYGRPVRSMYAQPAFQYRAARPSAAEARRRRRDVLYMLMGAAGLTLGLALLIGGPVWYLQLFVDALLAAYVTLLARAQRLAEERMSTVRYLPQRQAVPEPALLYRRSGS